MLFGFLWFKFSLFFAILSIMRHSLSIDLEIYKKILFQNSWLQCSKISQYIKLPEVLVFNDWGVYFFETLRTWWRNLLLIICGFISYKVIKFINGLKKQRKRRKEDMYVWWGRWGMYVDENVGRFSSSFSMCTSFSIFH